MLHFHAMVQSSTRTNYDKYLRKSIIAVLIPKLSVLRIFMHWKVFEGLQTPVYSRDILGH